MPLAHAILVESIHPSAHQVFRDAEVQVHLIPGGLPEDQLLETINQIPGDAPKILGIRSKTQVSEQLLANEPGLVAVGAFCIGTDQIALDAASQQAVAVFNAPFANTRSVAELVLAEIIMLSRQLYFRSAAAHRGEWAKSANGAREVRGKTLGIVGYGHIGSQLSVLAESLGMRVLFYDVVTKLPLGNAIRCESLDELLASSDFVSLHVPDTEHTRNMFGSAELKRIGAKQNPAGGYLINASRGSVVDLEALRDVIQGGQLLGAAIDVFPEEPANNKEPFQSPLCGLEKIVLTPHIGGSTEEAQANIGLEVADSLCAFLKSGNTQSCFNLPRVDPGPRRKGPRLLNLHKNVPGVLSSINHLIAEFGANIESQQLGTRASLGYLALDLGLEPGLESGGTFESQKAAALEQAIQQLDTSLRTRLLT